jgi:hypothetical protein
MIARMDAKPAELKSSIGELMDECIAEMKIDRKETTASQDAIEANLEEIEPNPR